LLKVVLILYLFP